MRGCVNTKLNIQGRAMTHTFLIADQLNCNMLGQDAILILGLVIDGKRCYINHSYGCNEDDIDINSVYLNSPSPRNKKYCVTSK